MGASSSQVYAPPHRRGRQAPTAPPAGVLGSYYPLCSCVTGGRCTVGVVVVHSAVHNHLAHGAAGAVAPAAIRLHADRARPLRKGPVHVFPPGIALHVFVCKSLRRTVTT